MFKQCHSDHLTLTLLIVVTGFEMSTSCDQCFHLNKSCVLSENSKNCSECVISKTFCSFNSVPSNCELNNFLHDFEKVERERKATLEKLLRLEHQSEFL